MAVYEVFHKSPSGRHKVGETAADSEHQAVNNVVFRILRKQYVSTAAVRTKLSQVRLEYCARRKSEESKASSK